MKFHWLIIFIIANEIDPNYTFIDRLKSLKYSVENLANSLKNVKPLNLIMKTLSSNLTSRLQRIPRSHTLSLLEGSNGKWTNENITAIVKLLHNDSLHWSKDEVIQLLELISQSHTLELLNLFPEILNDCFRSDLTDTKEKKISECCVVWFNNFIDKLNLSNESDLIFSMFQRLELVHPLLSQRINIWQNLSDIAIERTKNCQENQIFDAINKMMLKNYS
ncbi:hypothetical protein GLOIN_2v1786933 [Rhizophagus irregularis DAOM 181602=DAOM 197198]|uniref:Uncharacterized protein n=1 Tax=Rhizophagus irregularis (strain DAOM 181602 / DAOM 197198 / MUCL 43194) TaxID=747089 RepID=A0A2P4P704_RHIID|nr:hypothetical protein GLOIN_2v1786933 [Rhizophagus irregularis DAOM 181602=DAOM 197198]POG61161.1 hypothetical protein GLOIN_2v1786933 [Rhizophagus irregularis DAOM 181602=DAOM 197198]GBC13195.2 hypothetical protein GLOIN_2v1786933 [Rhizophagus irregularis DAOM 181602=DAOM 197198]|eukprot:XP_025168027.1 hypothetical protein GLOIN_2v1786933 [Rhizophagus irregularis DAOM 181602=DAOM 197198]